MDRFYKRFLDRNVLLAVGVLPPTLFLFGGHVWQGLVFLACVALAAVEPLSAWVRVMTSCSSGEIAEQTVLT